MAVTLSNWH